MRTQRLRESKSLAQLTAGGVRTEKLARLILVMPSTPSIFPLFLPLPFPTPISFREWCGSSGTNASPALGVGHVTQGGQSAQGQGDWPGVGHVTQVIALAGTAGLSKKGLSPFVLGTSGRLFAVTEAV